VTHTAIDLDGHRPALRAHCRHLLHSSSEVDDAVQETLLRAWRTLDRFEERSSLATWLHRIATNVCVDMLRAPQRRARPLDLDADDGTPPSSPRQQDEVVETVEERDAVRRALTVALALLPPRQRTALLLGEVFGWRAAEIAALLGTTVASVNSALQRARATLRAVPPPAPEDTNGHHLLDRCLDAFEQGEIEDLAALLSRPGSHAAVRVSVAR
jgi:RNA polymerase sigma-70 factor (ECF subfamily)